MDEGLGGNNTPRKIKYPFILELVKSYQQLRMNFKNGKEVITETARWRNDMKFLFHLIQVFQFFEKSEIFPKVKFQKIPNLSNARWNSRVILGLLAFILLPEKGDSLLDICKFIFYAWSGHWFTDQMYIRSYLTVCKFPRKH